MRHVQLYNNIVKTFIYGSFILNTILQRNASTLSTVYYKHLILIYFIYFFSGVCIIFVIIDVFKNIVYKIDLFICGDMFCVRRKMRVTYDCRAKILLRNHMMFNCFCLIISVLLMFLELGRNLFYISALFSAALI